MTLPNSAKAIVDERKVREYLLSPGHPVGRFKAKFFASIGFQSTDWRELSEAIMELAATGTAQLAEESQYGRKYLVLGTLTGLGGTTADVRSVWFVRAGDDTPRLVTVYPR